ncbi:diacylglycerol kinase family lipid kinase [Leptospira sp. 96542]|nr:diacylglycerol kinase family lipid kinase [Leptospira sp. 96542]
MKIKVILNPVSGGGVSLKVWKTVEKELLSQKLDFSFEATTYLKSGREIATEAVKSGYRWIIGIGGDGTLSNIVNGLFENEKPIHQKVVFSPIPAGRGNDFVKTVRVPKNPKKAIKQILAGSEKKIDLISVQYTKEDNSMGKYLCLNLADFGMGGEVVYKVNRSRLGKILGGKAVFLIYTFLCLFSYKNKQIKISISPKEIIENKCRLVVCANGEYAGGGMWFAPNAKLDDGKFDFLAIQNVTIFETLMKFGKLYKGEVKEDEKVISKQVSEITASSNEDVYIDVDGENMGQLPAKFKILPKLLTIKC